MDHIIQLDPEKLSLPEHKQPCHNKLVSFFENQRMEKICGIVGPRSSGKSTLMQQAAQELSQNGKRCAFYVCTPDGTMDDLIRQLYKDCHNDITYVFIDNITALLDFLSMAAILPDIFGAMGMKIAISGEDTTEIEEARKEELYDRIIYVHTSKEDVLDLKVYEESIAEHQANPVTYSHEEVKKMLLEDEDYPHGSYLRRGEPKSREAVRAKHLQDFLKEDE